MLLHPFQFGLYLAESDTVFARVHLGPPQRTLLAKADDPNFRWITLKPNGAGEGGHVHVKVRVNPDGTAHVVHGPGALRGLRLTKLASPEQLKERAQARAEKRKADTAQARQEDADRRAKAQDDPELAEQIRKEDEAKEARQGQRQALEREMLVKRDELLRLAQDLTGDDTYGDFLTDGDPDAQDEYAGTLRTQAAQAGGSGDDETRRAAAGVLAGRHVRRIDSGLKRLEQTLVRDLVQDQDLRAAVLDGDTLDATQAMPDPKGGGVGYRRSAPEQAARQGYTRDDARAEAERVWEARVAEVEAESPDRAAAMREARDTARAISDTARELSGQDGFEAPTPATRVARDEVRGKAEKVRAFLKARRELDDLRRQARAAALDADPDATDDERAALKADTGPTGADLGMDITEPDAAFRQQLEQQIRDAGAADLTSAFLQEVGQESGGHADHVIRQAMRAHVGVGAHAHLGNALLAITGSDSLDRQVVDILGVDAAAQLAAHAIRRDTDPARLDGVRGGLSLHHDEQSLTRMQGAMTLAQAARADAAEIELPPITATTDAALVASLNRERRARIAEAHEALGTALGQVEAGAALNFALRGPGRDELRIGVGRADVAQLALNLRALGLQDGEYEIKRGEDEVSVTLNRAGLDRLTTPTDEAARRAARQVQAIKDGAEDEADFLPAGFVRRPASSFTDHPPVPTTYAAPLRTAGLTHDQVIQAQAGSRYADGWTPREINDHLLDTVAAQYQGADADAFRAQVAQLLPFAHATQRTNAQGEQYGATEFTDLNTDPAVRERLARLADAHLREHHPGEAGFHAQTLPDDPHTREAIFRAVANNPQLQAAFSAPGDLSGTREGRARTQAIRKYFMDQFGTRKARAAGQSLDEYDQHQTAQRDRKLAALGPEPQKWQDQSGGLGMFGGDEQPDGVIQFHPASSHEDRAAALREMGLRDEHVTWNSDRSAATLTTSGKDAVRAPRARARISDAEDAPHVATLPSNLNPAHSQWHERRAQTERDHQTSAGMWAAFVDTMGGTRRAYQAVQEHMQGELVTAVQHHLAAVTGQPLRLSKVTTQHYRKMLALTDPDKLDEIRAEDRRLMDQHRDRVQGRYSAMGDGGLLGAVDDARQKQDAAQQGMGSLFGADDLFGHAHGGEATAQDVRHLRVGPHERATLGHAAEERLAHMLASTRFGIDPKGGPVSLFPDVTWGSGTKHASKQRAAKALLKTGRLAGFFGTGSGKTATQIGAFTEAHARGQARKGVFVVPSIVRNQFGEEAARFLEPGRYGWHASEDPDGYAGRLRAYQDPGTHMIVSTHQTFRDDMIRAMADHQGVPAAAMAARFQGLPRPERAAALRAAMEHHGIPLDFLAMDEAHNSLNRAGKGDSLLSAVVEAALDTSKLKSLWTGSPVKNDPSEVHDWISKLDPDRYPDRDAFIRQYGVNMPASSEALQRLMDGYSYIDAVPADVNRTVTWGARDAQGQAAPIPLTPQQHQAYQDVLSTYQRARQARQDGRVDVDAMRALSPRSFDGLDEQEHEGVAQRLQGALGTLKHQALARVVNDHPAEHNAKVQHVLGLARERKGRGGVIFAHGRESIAMLRQQLEAQGHRVGVIDGATSADGKAAVRRAFDAGQHDIVLCSDAGAVGANLQKRGKWLVNYDLPQTQMTLEQRNARIDRQGQQDDIELHHLMTDTDHDRDNHARLERKRVLGSILQGQYRSMDDTGLARYLHAAHAERSGNGPYPEAAD
ncbi:helicase-related protein [Deinococcus sp. PEB2-67]